MAAPPLQLPGVPMEGLISTAPAPATQPDAATTTAPAISQPAEAPCETLYIQNLNEKIKPEGISFPTYFELISLIFCVITVMKQTLRGLFKTYGDVLDVVAHNNLRMRGQAFVSFSDSDVAKKAMREVQRFPLYSKPMVRVNLDAFSPGNTPLSLASIICKNAIRCCREATRSQQSRRAQKKKGGSQKHVLPLTSLKKLVLKLRLLTEKTRYTNPVKAKYRAKRLAAESQLLFYL